MLGYAHIPLGRPAGEFSIAEQQVVEIARALLTQPRVLIMDEPTSSLTQSDTEKLFAVIARLRAQGVSIIYVSHFLEECRRACRPLHRAEGRRDRGRRARWRRPAWTRSSPS